MFPNASSGWFWSSSPYAGGSGLAWFVYFGYGDGNGDGKEYGYSVRLVRGGQWTFGSLLLTTPTRAFTDNQDGTVTHKRTGLIWQRCSVGQTWTGSTCSGSASAYTYDAAMALTSTFAGHSDWRVPNENELLSIVEYGTYSPAINTAVFPNTGNGWFWSSSPKAYGSGYAWVVYFNNGEGGGYKGYDFDVRLVRGGQRIFGSLPTLDTTKARCRYAEPVYDAMWQQMQVNAAPSCLAVLRYHTWTHTTRLENNAASSYYSNRLDNVDTRSPLFDDRLQIIDAGIALVNDILDPDLRRALLLKDYKLTTNIMKSKGIVASLAAGQMPFKRNKVYGRVLDKTFKKIIVRDSGALWCGLLIDDATLAEGCANEVAKVGRCTVGPGATGWAGAAGCVVDATTSVVGIVVNTPDNFADTDIRQHLNGYRLINGYLDDYFKTGVVPYPLDDAVLENAIQPFADKLHLTRYLDYDLDFVKKGIRDGIARTDATAAKNIRLVESLRKLLQN